MELLREKYINMEEVFKNKSNDIKSKHDIKSRHDITEMEWLKCKKYFNYECAYCGLKLSNHIKMYKHDLSREHVINLGSNGIDNCVPVCKSCNASKGSKVMEEWYINKNYYDIDRLFKIYEWMNEDCLI